MKRSRRRTGDRSSVPGSRERSEMQTAIRKQDAEVETSAPVDIGAVAAGKAHQANELLRNATRENIARFNNNVNPYDGSELRFPYQVAPRRRVPVELHGVKEELKPGARVIPELVGGQAALDKLVERGLVLRSAGAR